MNRKRFVNLEALGVLIIYAGASLLHFSYEWSGGNIIALLFGSVNESVWENIKNFILPYALWAAFEFCAVRPPFKKFVIGKVCGIYLFIFANAVFFFTYTAFSGGPILIIDLLQALVWLILAQLVSCRITQSDIKTENIFPIAACLLFLLFACYFTFTAFPPKIRLFLDERNMLYGVPHEFY